MESDVKIKNARNRYSAGGGGGCSPSSAFVWSESSKMKKTSDSTFVYCFSRSLIRQWCPRKMVGVWNHLCKLLALKNLNWYKNRLACCCQLNGRNLWLIVFVVCLVLSKEERFFVRNVLQTSDALGKWSVAADCARHCVEHHRLTTDKTSRQLIIFLTFLAERDEVGTALCSHVCVVVVVMQDPPPTTPHQLTPPLWADPPLLHNSIYHVITWWLSCDVMVGGARPLRWRSVLVWRTNYESCQNDRRFLPFTLFEGMWNPQAQIGRPCDLLCPSVRWKYKIQTLAGRFAWNLARKIYVLLFNVLHLSCHCKSSAHASVESRQLRFSIPCSGFQGFLFFWKPPKKTGLSKLAKPRLSDFWPKFCRFTQKFTQGPWKKKCKQNCVQNICRFRIPVRVSFEHNKRKMFPLNNANIVKE